MLILLMTAVITAQAQRPISKLEKILGVWNVEEKHTTGWSERGVRTCSYILDSTYIECETRAVSSTGKKRVYRFLLNHNSQADKFEMAGIYSNWPLKQFDLIDIEGTVWSIGNLGLPGGDVSRESQLQFESNDAYAWRGKNTNLKTGKVTEYEEKGVRRK